MPLSDYDVSPIVSFWDRLHEVGTSAFLYAVPYGPDLRPSALGPRITVVLWAPSRGAAKRIMSLRLKDDDGACGTLPAELVPAGAVPQYGSIFAALRSSDRNAFDAASYRTHDDKFNHRFIATPRVTFYFRDRDDNSEPPFGAAVRLHTPEGAVRWGGTSIGPQPETRAESKPAVSWERVGDRLGGSVIAVSFAGVYPPGSAGSEFGKAMIGFLQFILDETRAAGVIIDLTSLDYVWGDTIGGLAMPLREKGKRVRPAVIVAAGRTADALQSLLEPNFLLGIAGVRLVRTRQEAVAYIDRVLGHHAG